MNIPQRLRQLAASTGLDGFAHELRAIADEMDAQPADLTDEQIFEVLKQVDPEAKRLPPGISKFARAILALRPVQVPMTREEILAMVDDYTFFGTAEEIVRAIEAHHGIKPKEQA